VRDEAEQYRAMKSLGVWLSGSLGFTPGTIGGIKPDGTTFHHGGFYPAYSTGAFAMIGYFCKATRGTDFTLSEQARRNFKLALMTMPATPSCATGASAWPAAIPSARTAASPTPTSTHSVIWPRWAT